VVTPLRVAFFGTPLFARATLERLVASAHHVVLVVTQPDRPRGRGHHVVASPVKTFAVERGIPVLQPERLRDPSFLDALAGYRLDLAVVAAYGRILPAALLPVPRLGMINVHASLLPRWRGAAPVHRAVLAGDKETGVTIMRVAPALDAGPMLAKVHVDIGPHETSAVLESRLATLGADLLVATVDRLAAGPIAETPQSDEHATYASRLERSESRVDWDQPAPDIHNRIRGLQPWPVATVMWRGRRLRLLGSVPEDLNDEKSHRAVESDENLSRRDFLPGTIVAVDEDSFVVACHPGAVRIVRVQVEGRAPAAVREFLHGHRVSAGDTLEPLPTDI
jgi:methionyl-tRNA formyltransferase